MGNAIGPCGWVKYIYSYPTLVFFYASIEMQRMAVAEGSTF